MHTRTTVASLRPGKKEKGKRKRKKKRKSSPWWRRCKLGTLTLTGQSFCSVRCLSCASGSRLCGGILWVGCSLPVCLLPVPLVPAPQKRSCNSVLCSSNTPPWSAAPTRPAVPSATNSSSVAKLSWSTWSTPTRIPMHPELPVSIYDRSRERSPSISSISLFLSPCLFFFFSRRVTTTRKQQYIYIYIYKHASNLGRHLLFSITFFFMYY